MKLGYRYKEGRFESRPNRFIAKIWIDGSLETVHVPNTGRLKELLPKGARVLVSHHGEESRKTAWSLRFIHRKGLWVSMDSQLPNKVVEEALASGGLPELGPYEDFRSEAAYGKSRFDFRLEGTPPVYLEVKGVTLEKDGWGYFPDAPTERGRRHLKELIEAVGKGYGAAVVFLNQNPHAKGFSPHDETDPAFGDQLRKAAARGVSVLAYTCRVSPEEVSVTGLLPVRLEGQP